MASGARDAGFAFVIPDAGPSGTGNAVPAPTVPSTGPWGGQFVDPALPATAPAMFSGQETMTGGPTVVYPLDGSLHPTNLLDMTVQWRQGARGQAIYRLRLDNEHGSYDIFAPCSVAECTYSVPEDTWLAVAGMNRYRDVRLSITAARTSGAEDAVSPAVTLHFSAIRKPSAAPRTPSAAPERAARTPAVYPIA
jgi:hypothetical protein